MCAFFLYILCASDDKIPTTTWSSCSAAALALCAANPALCAGSCLVAGTIGGGVAVWNLRDGEVKAQQKTIDHVTQTWERETQQHDETRRRLSELEGRFSRIEDELKKAETNNTECLSRYITCLQDKKCLEQNSKKGWSFNLGGIVNQTTVKNTDAWAWCSLNV